MAKVEKSNNENQNTRWWESYLVRYFLGFIVGGIASFLIALEFDVFELATCWLKANGFSADGKVDFSTFAIAIGILGLGFCYLVSTPITVLHAGRYRRGPVDAHTRYFWFGWLISLIFGVLFGSQVLNWSVLTTIGFIASGAAGSWLCLCWADHEARELESAMGTMDERNYVLPTHPFYAWAASVLIAFFLLFGTALVMRVSSVAPVKTTYILLLFGTPTLWIGVMQYAVLFRLLNEADLMHRFYAKLFTARRSPKAKEVRETYTHLREHSNSIFIVLIELCVLAFVVGLGRLTKTTEQGQGIFAVYFLSFVGLWMLPTVFMWSRANAMERSFAKDPEQFY